MCSCPDRRRAYTHRMPNSRIARPLYSWPLASLPDIGLGQARARFFVENDFGVDGGYDSPHQEAVLAGIPYRTPNPPARAAALRRHDLHHLLTGYSTDWLGEARISAWELGSGGPGAVFYAWTIVLWGLFTGLVGDPVGSLRAFVRGRGSDNLFGSETDEALMQRSVAAVGRSLRVRAAAPSGTIWHGTVSIWQRALDLVAFAGWSACAALYVTLAMPGIIALVLSGILANATRGCQPCQLLGPSLS